MRAGGGGWNEYPDHRPGRAAAAAISKTRRPGPGRLVIGSLGPAVRKLHPRSTSVRPWRVVSSCAAWLLIEPGRRRCGPAAAAAPPSSHSRAAFGHSYCLLRHWRRCRFPSMRRTRGGHLSQASLVEASASAHDALCGRSGHCVLGGQVRASGLRGCCRRHRDLPCRRNRRNFDSGSHSLHYRSHFARPAKASSQRDERDEAGPSQDEDAVNGQRALQHCARHWNQRNPTHQDRIRVGGARAMEPRTLIGQGTNVPSGRLSMRRMFIKC